MKTLLSGMKLRENHYLKQYQRNGMKIPYRMKITQFMLPRFLLSTAVLFTKKEKEEEKIISNNFQIQSFRKGVKSETELITSK